jgi:superfamily I DNA/RNA helicase
MTLELTLTSEQQAILDAFEGRSESMIIEADAGSAKTTVLTLMAKRQARRPIPAIAIAFNKKTAVELQARMPPSFKCMTFNGMGYGAWAKKLGGRKLTVSEYKISELIKDLAKDMEIDLGEDGYFEVMGLVNGARASGLIHSDFAERFQGLVPDQTDVWEDFSDSVEVSGDFICLAREVLLKSTELALEGTVDFDDMIYCSVLMGGLYTPYPLAMVDEMQDLNPLNIMQLAKVSRDRIIAVGDPKQSIYQFRGADEQAIENIKALRPRWIELPLHVTFRCPKVIVARQQDHAPGFTAAPGNPEGEHIRWIKGDEYEGAITWRGLRTSTWTWEWLRSLCEIGEKPFVLCRNNAPLMRLAFRLLKQGKIPVMLGRDIGKGLVSLSKKIAPKDSMPTGDFADAVEKWMRGEIRKAQEGKRAWLVAGITDRGESLLAVAETCRAATVGELRKEITALFRRSEGDCELSTIHRAKGLEKPVVMHLDPWRIPSKYALEAASIGDMRQLNQENNLRYVGETRTRRVFVEANVDDFGME